MRVLCRPCPDGPDVNCCGVSFGPTVRSAGFQGADPYEELSFPRVKFTAVGVDTPKPGGCGQSDSGRGQRHHSLSRRKALAGFGALIWFGFLNPCVLSAYPNGLVNGDATTHFLRESRRGLTV